MPRSSLWPLLSFCLGVVGCSADTPSTEEAPIADARPAQKPSGANAFPSRTTDRSFRDTGLPNDAALHIDAKGIWLEDPDTKMKVHVASLPLADSIGVLPELANALKPSASHADGTSIRLDIEATVPANTVRRVMTTVRAMDFRRTAIAYARDDGSTMHLQAALESPFVALQRCETATKIRVLPGTGVQIDDREVQTMAALVEKASILDVESCLHVELAAPTTFGDVAPLIEALLDDDGSTVLLVHGATLDDDVAPLQRDEARALWDEVRAAKKDAGARECAQRLADANAALNDGDRQPYELRLLATVEVGCGTRQGRLNALRELVQLEPREADNWRRLGQAEYPFEYVLDAQPKTLLSGFGSHHEAVAANTRAIEAYEHAESLTPEDAVVLLALHHLHQVRARVIRRTAAIEQARTHAKTYLGKACKASTTISVCAGGGRDCCP